MTQAARRHVKAPALHGDARSATSEPLLLAPFQLFLAKVENHRFIADVSRNKLERR